MAHSPELAPELRGPRVLLTPLTAEHRTRLREIHREPEVRRWWQMPDDDWPDAAEPNTTRYTVLADGVIVGYAQWYAEPDPEYRRAGLDLFLSAAAQGRGLGTEVVRVLCAHLIDDHHHHRLVIDPTVSNTAAIGCYRKVGFRDVGVMREYAMRHDGSWDDGLLMDLLAREFVR
ncbi:GNAT family N-acetyltransferase [Rhodococcus sp. NPDC058505]|uniref:GNAT family N-acetyltransferase n=1 Tax=Rhodococcus sp. NPDC058505 TaxID=3346531 RepID=UPI003656901B